MQEYLRVGVLTSPHGVKGEISVYPTTDDVERFRELKKVYFDVKGSMVPRIVTSCKFKKGYPVLGFQDIDSIDDIVAFRGIDIYVDRAAAVPLEEGEFFLADIIGFEVYSEGEAIGTLTDYYENAASQVIFIVSCTDGTEKQIPDVPDYVKGVDMELSRVYVRLIKGM